MALAIVTVLSTTMGMVVAFKLGLLGGASESGSLRLASGGTFKLAMALQ
jgi:hypothetical protein